MGKFFKKHVVDAVQYVGTNFLEVIDFTEGKAIVNPVYSALDFNDKQIQIGDYVVKENGVVNSYRPNIFESIYQPLNK